MLNVRNVCLCVCARMCVCVCTHVCVWSVFVFQASVSAPLVERCFAPVSGGEMSPAAASGALRYA